MYLQNALTYILLVMKNNSKSFSESAIFLNFIVSAFLTKKLLIFIAFKVICQCSLTSMLQIIMISSLEMLYLVVSKTFVFLYVRCFFTDHNIKVKKSCHLYQHFTEDIIYIWYSVFSVLFFSLHLNTDYTLVRISPH